MGAETLTIRPVVETLSQKAAACESDLSFTTASQETWMETTVEGPGNVSFRYKMASAYGDALYFYVDTTIKAYWRTMGVRHAPQEGSGRPSHNKKQRFVSKSSVSWYIP